MMKPIIVSLIILISTSAHAQWWVEPSVNIGTTRLNWGESVEIKTSQPTWEVTFGYDQRRFSPWDRNGAVFTAAYMGQTRTTFGSEQTQTPFSLSGVAFNKKDNKAQGQTQGSSAGSKGIVVDAASTRGMVECMVGGASPISSAYPLVRAEYLDLRISATGEVDGKTVTAEESFRRWYPQIGASWEHNTGPSWVRVTAAVGTRSSHLEGNFNWWVSPRCWLSVGGKRDHMSFDQGRLEDARFTVGAGVRW